MRAATWRTKSGIIAFHLTAPTGGEPVRAMRRLAAAFAARAREIGAVQTMSISTAARGEDAQEWFGGIGNAQIAELDAHADLTQIVLGCDLACTDADGGAIEIAGGLSCWIQLAELDAPPSEPLEIDLTLDTDIYLPTTWGESRDNRALSAQNGPAFNRFFAELLRATGCTVASVSAGDYPGQVTAAGLVLAS